MKATLKAKLGAAVVTAVLMTACLPALALADTGSTDQQGKNVTITEIDVNGEKLTPATPSTAIVSPEGDLSKTQTSATATSMEKPSKASNGPASVLDALEDEKASSEDVSKGESSSDTKAKVEGESASDDSLDKKSNKDDSDDKTDAAELDNQSDSDADVKNEDLKTQGQVIDAKASKGSAATKAATVKAAETPDETPILPQDDSGTCGDLSWSLVGDTLTISGSGAMEDYSIADLRPWHAYASSITQLVLDGNITVIGEHAFYGFNQITSVAIPSTVQEIKYSAFCDCTSLYSVLFIGPSQLNTIGQAAFARTALGSIEIPDSVSSIKGEAFNECHSLNSVTIGSNRSSLTEIAGFAFDDVNDEAGLPAIASVSFAGTLAEWGSVTVGQGNTRLTTNMTYDEAANPPAPTYTITFDANGGTLTSSASFTTNTSGTLDSFPGDPSWADHTFDGWFDAQYGGNQIFPNTPFSSDVTIYAHWTEIQQTPEPVIYTVEFNANGGYFYGGGESYPINTGENGYLTSQPETPLNSGMEFDGWYSDPEYGTKFDTSSSITGNMTLYAHWISIEGHVFSVTFNANSGSFDDGKVSTQSLTNAHGIVKNIPSNPTHPGYIFQGWYDNSVNGQGDPLDLNKYVFTANTTIYAHWQKDYSSVSEYTITFYWNYEGNSGVYTTENTTNFSGYHYIVSFPDDPKRDGYIFDGWFTDSGIKVIDLATSNDAYVFTEDANVYAHWTEGQQTPVIQHYTIIFSANGGELGSAHAMISTDDNGMLSMTQSDPTYDGYTFTGWYDAAEGGNKISLTSPFTSGMHLYAHWEPNEVTPPAPTGGKYNVTFEPNGGTLSDEGFFTTGEDGKLTAVSAAPQKDGYVFKGWYDAREGGNQVTTSTVFGADSTVYAHWEAVTTPPSENPGDDQQGNSGNSGNTGNNGGVTTKPSNSGNSTANPSSPGTSTTKPSNSGTSTTKPSASGSNGGVVSASKPPVYTVIEGADSEWVFEDGKDLEVRADGDYSKFDLLKVDGETIDKSNYTVREGSTIATLKQDYLATLGEGPHDLTFVYKDGGEARTSFTIAPAPAVYEPSDDESVDGPILADGEVTGSANIKTVDSPAPKTGDEMPVAPYLVLVLAGIAFIGARKYRQTF